MGQAWAICIYVPTHHVLSSESGHQGSMVSGRHWPKPIGSFVSVTKKVCMCVWEVGVHVHVCMHVCAGGCVCMHVSIATVVA